MRIERYEWGGRRAEEMAARLRALVPGPESVRAEVSGIRDRVRAGGDEALRELAERFGEPAPREIAQGALEEALDSLQPEVREALEVTARNIEATARAEMEAIAPTAIAEPPQGQRIEVHQKPVTTAGIYAPGGRAAYPSSVLMGGIPARVADVFSLVVMTPPGPEGQPSPVVLAACHLVDAARVYAIGGAQAIAAMTYGTESIERVDVIAGPGNRYVTEAKRQVAGEVGIDGVAGPTELFVLADVATRPDWVALDLCAQAEHGADSLLVVVANDGGVLDRVAEQVRSLEATRPSVADASLALVEIPWIDGLGNSAIELAAELAPEHLEIASEESIDDLDVRHANAGCVIRGAGGATAFGDYAAGSNHVLPTGGTARFGGPLGPGTFLRRISVVTMSREAAAALAPHVEALARAEGLPVHGESARARTEGPEWEPPTEEESEESLGLDPEP